MNYQCPVCAVGDMPYPPADYSICYCCGTEFGLDDDMDSTQELRERWLQNGGPWFSTIEPYCKPMTWNAWDQLDLAGFSYSTPAPKPIVNTYYTELPEFVFHLAEPDHPMALAA